jgi:tRNA-dihydrouridine synthase
VQKAPIHLLLTKNLVFIKIGQYQLKSQVLLAPMAGTSDKPFRMLCKTQGAALTTSEMVVIQQHLLNTNKSKYRLMHRELAPNYSQLLCHVDNAFVFFS